MPIHPPQRHVGPTLDHLGAGRLKFDDIRCVAVADVLLLLFGNQGSRPLLAHPFDDGQAIRRLFNFSNHYEVMAFVNAVAYLADSCWDDLEKHCGEVEMGEGRVATCLLENEEKVAPACQQAIKDVELEVIED